MCCRGGAVALAQQIRLPAWDPPRHPGAALESGGPGPPTPAVGAAGQPRGGDAGGGRKPGPGEASPCRHAKALLFFPEPLSPAPSQPAQNPSPCQRQIRRSFPPRLGQRRQTRSPSACWFPTSRRSGSGVRGALPQMGALLKHHAGSSVPTALYEGDRLATLTWGGGRE